MTRLNHRLAGLVLALCFASTAGAEEPPKGLATFEMEGKVGPYAIGATITVRDYAQVVAGHYFYANPLTDRLGPDTPVPWQTWVHQTQQMGAQAMVHVNYGSTATDGPGGTDIGPQEAAAWVRQANIVDHDGSGMHILELTGSARQVADFSHVASSAGRPGR